MSRQIRLSSPADADRSGKVRESLSKRRRLIGAIALAVGGLAPMVTGLVGLHGYYTQGYFVAKTGQTVSGATAWIASSVFILAGLGMMALAVWQYHRYR